MRFSEALLAGSRRLAPAVRERRVFVGSKMIAACAMGLAEIGAGVAHAETVWPWLTRDCQEVGARPICDIRDCRVNAQIMAYWDDYGAGATLTTVAVWIQNIEAKLPYEEVERCVPGECWIVANTSAPEPTRVDLACVDALIATASTPVLSSPSR